jgi:4-amino-4-deoxy-L-arabinose transferase-like glycosyltransferase
VTRLPRSESPLGGPPVAFAAILIGAAVLRLVGIRYGLPHGSLLDPDEQNVVPRAWRMVHGGGADPHFFDWPTLVTYLEAPFQWWHASPSYLTGRLVVVGLGVLGVAAAWWLGAVAYGTIAGAVAAATTAVATTHVAYSHAAVTDVPLTTFVTVALALLVMNQPELAGVAIGVATAAKYPGALLFVPLVVLTWRRWGTLAISAALAAVAFAVASPYTILRVGDAWSALRRVQSQHRRGWLGFEHDHWSGIAFTGRLWDAIGPVLLIALAGLVAALMRRKRPEDVVLASFFIAYFVSLLPLHSHFDRYVLPLVPVCGALAGRLRGIAAVTLLLLVVPFAWSARNDARLTHTDTRVVAARWIDAHVPKGATIAAESSTAVPEGYRVVALRLPLPGKPADRNVAELRGRAGWVLVSGAVADRVERARDRYPQDAAFYSQLESRTRRVLRIEPGDGLSGPWVALYRL